MSGGIVSFGTYTIPGHLKEFDTNFSNAVPKTLRLPGMDGGWNMDGDQPADREIGRVTVGWVLLADTREEMDAKRDAVRAMQQLGLARLVYQPTDSGEDERYCYARVNAILMPQRKDLHTDLVQDVRVMFQVPNPVWMVDTYVGHRVGEPGLTIDGSWMIGSGGVAVAASAPSTTQVLTNNGNAPVIPEIFITTGAGQGCTNPRIWRDVEGVVADEVKRTGHLDENGAIIIDGRHQRIAINGQPDWANISYKHPAFLRLMPGDNTIKIEMLGGSAATVTFFYEEGYF